MKFIFKKLKRNQGFSLSELLAVIALLSVLMIGVTVLISSGAKTYNNSLYISEVSSVENMINKALARELRYAKPEEVDGSVVKKFSVDGQNYQIAMNAAGYLVESNVNGGSGATKYLINLGSYAGMHLSEFEIEFSDKKVFTCNYTIVNRNNTKSKDVEYTVRTAVFLREGWSPGHDAPPPVVPTPQPPDQTYYALTIDYKLDDGTLIDTYRGLYSEGSHYSVKSPEIAEYTAEPSVVTDEDGKGILKNEYETVIYSLRPYKITYYTDPTYTYTHSNPSEYYANSEFDFDNAMRPGYKFIAWYKDPELTKTIQGISRDMTGDITVYPKWERKPANYTVEYYLQNADGSFPERPETTSKKTGWVGEMTDASPDKVFDHYQTPSKSSIEQKVVLENGSTAVQIYYYRNTHTVHITYVDNDATSETDDAIKKVTVNNRTTSVGNNNSYRPETIENIIYGSSYTFSKANPEGYVFDSISASPSVSITDKSFVMPDSDVELTVTYNRKSYTLSAYGMNAEFNIKMNGRNISTNKFDFGSSSGTSGAYSVKYGTKLQITDISFDRSSTRYCISNNSSTIGTSTDYKYLQASYSADTDYYIYMPDPGTNNSVYLGAVSSSGGFPCIAEGTLITLADGSVKPVEKITAKDQVLVFNHETGKLDSSIMALMVHNGNSAELRRVMYLVFSDGTELKVVADHGLFDMASRKYVYIDESNCYDYVGHEFLKEKYKNGSFKEESIRLMDVYFTEETIRYFAPITRYHLNYFSNDMLSMTSLMDGLFNIFELDEDLKYDEQLMQEDIEKYGLFSYEDYIPYGVYPELYDYFPSQYFSVSIGKGMITMDHIFELANEYFTEENFLKE